MWSLSPRSRVYVEEREQVVLGWLLIGCGVWLHVFPESFFYSPLLLENPTGPIVVLDRLSVALMIVGVILFIIGFLGSCGTCTESVCFLGFFSTLVILSIGTQVIVVILASSFKYQMQSNLERSFYYQVRYEYNNTAQYTNDTMSDIYRLTVAWDRLQTKLGCCGSRGPQDYLYSSWNNHSTVDLFVPSSCCLTSGTTDDTLRPADNYFCQLEAVRFNDNINGDHHENDDNEDPISNIFTKGCSEAVSDWVVNYLPVITVVVLLDALQVINLFYACCLIKDIRQKLSEYSWCEDDEEAS